MKTTSRKRLLISSVAMLLVAMLALGTATFAWFTQDTRSYADKINVRTSKVSSLVLSKSDRTNWQSHIEYDVDRIMFPASSSNGSKWFYANASDALSGEVDNESIKDAQAPGTTTADYVFINELNIKNAGAVKVTDVKIKFNLQGENSDYARVALVPIGVDGSATTTDGTFGTGTVYGKKATPYQPISSLAGDLGASITPSTTYEVSVPDLDVDKAAYYALYVWFEGQDVDCKDANSGQKIPNLVFDVEGTPVEE